MSDDPCKIGMMHPAYRVGKLILLHWINSNFDLNYTKVEECATGAFYCQLLDAIYPKYKMPMKKIKWKSQSEAEWLNNWKLVQACFSRFSIDKNLSLDLILKGKFQDNLELLQWFRHFTEVTYTDNIYNAKSRRKYGNNDNGIVLINRINDLKSGKTPSGSKNIVLPVSAKVRTKKPKKKKSPQKGVEKPKINKKKDETKELEINVEAVSKERNFYFGKLREIEILIQETSESDPKKFKDQILAIMYRTDEEGDMVAPDEGDGDPNQNENDAGSANDDNTTF